jgi:SNF2 family DNA or RNA helicase
VAAVAGNAAERLGQLKAWSQYDLLVTSYDLLRRDIEHYKDLDFNYVVLDEAQYIKNQNTQNAKAVKLLHGRTRLALTGTPIENSLAELWSIFDFLMPGYLYNYHKFCNKFEKPIAKDQNSRITERLRSLVRPFILRRLKNDVLKELPQKIESVQVASFDAEQSKLYLATFAQVKKDLSAGLADAGAGQSRIMVLAALTRMRQICCDPSLVFDGYKGGSAKLELCLELVQNCMESGHRMLLFSQFTSMLDILERELDKCKVKYYRLDGSTPKAERLKLVNAFNEGETPVFLISLKAGGTGLNLTGADVVIHYDPWWNLSAQNQATDRTHRIGQTNAVQVFKLIAKDTIEERIIELQQKKAQLADSVIQEGGNNIDAITGEELLALLDDR